MLEPGEVLVEVELATVCGSDLHTVSGSRPGPCPGVLGHEQVGRVIAVGPEAPRCLDGAPVVPGSRVVWSVAASCLRCARCRAGMPQKCLHLRKYGHEAWDETRPLRGGFATHCVLWPGTAIAVVDESLPAEVAAPVSCATATVAAAVGAAGPIREGMRALVNGAGMLGLTAVAMLAASGAEVIAVDPHEHRRDQALRFGAAGAQPVGSPIGEVDVALELSGSSEAVQTCLDYLAVGGTAVLAGSVSPGPAVNLDPERLVRGLHRVVGVHNYHPDDLRTAVEFITTHHDRHPFADLVAGSHSLDDLDIAITAAHRGEAPRQAVRPRPLPFSGDGLLP
ncbi:zinc-binding dehydrogenase [Saccharopolyspora sp. TS4A08]|uniref:alcohol dehydrogenase n=1 Tax=Saccharopolyspora ipomoeae TaxID=3042027 RepID=A0ABT6PHJ2_9PSEU|nr:zinc-binding dehydrogenase [Saccharopolyspora sp. TS4A08]MDI2027466.1 zinc-binding dehydrogenase [Saccharopolyspora sp. TS4A08]